MNKDLSKKIKKQLLKGGLIIAQRGVGKTRAIAMILAENPNSVAIVGLEAQRFHLKAYLKELGVSDSRINNQVLHSGVVLRSRYIDFLNNRDIYVDELDKNPYKGPFKAATTSVGYRVKVID